MQITSKLYLPIITLGLYGCATPDPIRVPYPVPVPEACLMPCEYTGPETIRTNGDLLEAYRGKVDQVACLTARLQCVRDASD
jgi:hypothetical protein